MPSARRVSARNTACRAACGLLPGPSDYYTIRDVDAFGTAGVQDLGTGKHKTVTGNW